MVNKHASELSKKRWAKKTKKQRSEHMTMMIKARWKKAKKISTGKTKKTLA